MAKPVSEEELQLKKRARRRLIGAIALVAATAAVLPMVLDSDPKPTSQDINIQIPPVDTKAAQPAKAPAAPTTAATPAVTPAPTNTADKAPTPVKSEPVEPEKIAGKSEVVEKSAPPPRAAPKATFDPNDAVLSPEPRVAPEKAGAKPVAKATEKASEKAATPKAAPGSFFIQVIALSDTDKAKQVQQKAADAGVRAYTEVVSAGAGKVTRVRAGPFATREEADKAQAKLQGIGLEGKVATY